MNSIDHRMQAALDVIATCETVLKRKEHRERRNNALVAIAELRRLLRQPAFKR